MATVLTDERLPPNPSTFPAFRVLVVDDEQGFRDLCVDLLADNGYVTESATNGQEALDRMAKTDYHLVLSDINMPLKDGLTFLKESKIFHPNTEVILMTAYGGLQTAVEALRHGAYDYITKPFTRDVLLATIRRCLEKQRLASELRKVQLELIQKERLAALGSVSGWLAHRMRNPLNVIMMCTQYLKTRFSPEDDRREVTTAIEDKIKILEQMTRDFIGFSRNYEPRLHPEDLHELLNNVLGARATAHRLQSVKVEKRYEDPLPLVPLDKELMEEVLGYIVDNALEAMPEGGELKIHVGKSPVAVTLNISNTGSVISPENRTRLFEPFFTTKERGTGLGLAIARRVVESHGGEITLLDDPLTTFRIRLPSAKPT